MFRRVLLTTDGSPLSRAAIPHALRVVDRTSSEVVVIEVQVDTIAGPQEDVEQIRTALRSAGVTNVDAAVLAGKPGPAIVSHAHAIGADVVVMATHGRSGLGRALFGSVADHVMHELGGIPVLLVHASETDAQPFSGNEWIVNSAQLLQALQPYRRVLVPIDGSDFSLAVLPTIADALDPSVAEVELVTIVDLLPSAIREALPKSELAAPTGDGPDSMADHEANVYYEAASARLALARTRLEALGIRVNAAVREGMPPEEALAELVRRHGVELVAMATHGRSGIARSLLGSVPTYLVGRLPGVPFLLQRPVQ